MGKIFKALQRYKKERPPAVHTSRARGVKRPVQFRKEVEPREKVQPEKTEKTPSPTPEMLKKSPPAQTGDFDLGSIHGMLTDAGDTESPGGEQSGEVVSEKHLTELSDRDLPSIHDLVDGELSDLPAYERPPQPREKPEFRQDDTPAETAEAEKEPLAGLMDEPTPEMPLKREEEIEASDGAKLIEELDPTEQPSEKDLAKIGKRLKEVKPEAKSLTEKKVISLKKDKAAIPDKPDVMRTPGGQKPRKKTSKESQPGMHGRRIVDDSLVTLLKPRSFESEQFKLLRTNLMYPVSGEPPKSILVTSALPGDGKTYVATNMAISFALHLDRRVMLIDCDIRKPEIHSRFGFSEVSGLSDYLTHGESLPSLLLRTNLTNLTILPGGQPPHNPSELLSSEKMPALLKEVTTRYADRYVIIDAPPPKMTAETGVLARLVDGIILVVRDGNTPRDRIEELLDILGKDKILGVVLNHHDIKASRYYGYGMSRKQKKYFSEKESYRKSP